MQKKRIHPWLVRVEFFLLISPIVATILILGLGDLVVASLYRLAGIVGREFSLETFRTLVEAELEKVLLLYALFAFGLALVLLRWIRPRLQIFAAGALLLGLGALRLLNQRAFELGAMEKAQEREKARAETVIASTRPPDKIGPTAKEPYFRLDSHLDMAEATIPARLSREELAGSLELLTEADFERQDRDGKPLFISRKEIRLPLSDVGSLTLLLRTRASTNIIVGVNHRSNSKKARSVVSLIADGDPHSYSLDLKRVIGKTRSNRNAIENIFIELPQGDESFEILSIRIDTFWSSYPESAGTTYIDLEDHLRPALYCRSPVALSYRLSIPEEGAYLEFATGILRAGAPVAFRLSARVDDAERVFFESNVVEERVWSEHRIALDPLAGKTVDLQLECRSSDPNVGFWSSPVIRTESNRRFNVVLYLEDALRARQLGTYGYHREVSRHRDKFAGEGAIFENAYSQASASHRSCPSFMTSLHPVANGVDIGYDFLADEFTTLAEMLRSRGFETRSITQNPHSAYMNGLHQGFDDTSLAPVEQYRATEGVINEEAFEWLEESADRNFFLFLHIAKPHGPYDPPVRYRHFFDSLETDAPETLQRQANLDPGWLESPTAEARTALYDGQIAYNDDLFGQLWVKLDELGLKDDTLFIMMSDHGEFLGEHGLWGHSPPAYAEGVHVPLIMVYPRQIEAGRRITANVQLLDIVPTVLDYAQVDRVGLPLQGDSLRTAIEGRNSEFWRDRVVYTHEYPLDTLDSLERRSHFYGSVLFRELQFMNSQYFALLRSKISPDFSGVLSRVFDRADDPAQDSFFNRFTLDYLFKLEQANFLSEMHKKSMRINEAISGGGELYRVLTGGSRAPQKPRIHRLIPRPEKHRIRRVRGRARSAHAAAGRGPARAHGRPDRLPARDRRARRRVPDRVRDPPAAGSPLRRGARGVQPRTPTYRDFVTNHRIPIGSRGGWARFLMLTSRSEEGRRAFLAYRRQKAISQASPAKLRLLETLLERHRGDRALIFTSDNEAVYRISRQFLIPAITHQTKVKERHETLQKFNAGDYPFVVTSKVLNEGVDVPAANVGIVLSGSGSVREHVQRLGRILRRGEGKRAVLYEVVAEDTAEEFTSSRRRQHGAYQRGK